ncbi:hypothetical protein TNCV_578431 [Trichonephila clavipes]|nr:hypothetical protein TNCV_578431 [Trichonephila clavipes]
MNHGQVTVETLELAPPLPTTSHAYKRRDILHQFHCPTEINPDIFVARDGTDWIPHNSNVPGKFATQNVLRQSSGLTSVANHNVKCNVFPSRFCKIDYADVMPLLSTRALVKSCRILSCDITPTNDDQKKNNSPPANQPRVEFEV